MITLQQILLDKKVTIINKEHSPLLLPDFNRVLEILNKHVSNGHNIGILGDFDTDGITATSSFILGFRDLFPQIKTFYRVPERSEGHGLSKKNIDWMLQNNVKLLFTCDNGSNDVEQIQYAKSLGLDVIVTDHHQITISNFDYCLVNCERLDSQYPYPHLCGCGIIYKLLQGIELSGITSYKLSAKTKETLQRLVTIGTVVDMVRLDDENLYFVQNFKHLFDNTTNSNFFSLLTQLTNYHSDNGKWYGWSVGPLFNGAGRLERANGLIQTIVEQDTIKNLQEIIQYYINLNNYRKELTKSWNQYLQDKIIRSKHVNIIRDSQIPSGLKRLIANEYLEGKVSFCGASNSENSNIIDCSVSNSYGINLLDFLGQQSYTVGVGGHYGAFGFSYYLDQEQEFLDSLNKFIDSQDVQTKNIKYDYELHFSDINLDLAREISSFVWGTGLEEPIFKIKGTCISGKILAEKHMKLSVKLEDGRTFDIIKWGQTDFSNYLNKLYEYNVTIDINRYMGKETIQFFLV